MGRRTVIDHTICENVFYITLSFVILGLFLLGGPVRGHPSVIGPSLPNSTINYAVGLTLVPGHISDAMRVVQGERVETRAERDAFDAFIGRVKSISPIQTTPPVASRQQIANRVVTERNGLQQVQDAYAETIMAVDHYEDEYNEPLAENLSAELSPDIAAQILTGQSLTPIVKQQIVQTARQCQQKRVEHLSTLQTEQNALEGAQTTLSDISEQVECIQGQCRSDQSFDDLTAFYTQLMDAEDECKALLEERQQHRTDGHATLSRPRESLPDLYSYLYEPLPVTYPVLADGTTLLEEIRSTRQQILHELTTRA